MSLPADIVNRSLSQAGSDLVIGDLEEGTNEARRALMQYAPTLKQILRCAAWNFARQESPLQLLADASGATPNVGTLVPTPWLYLYALPIDCMKARWVPQGRGILPAGAAPPGNIVPPNNQLPLTGAIDYPPSYRLGNRPARFLVATDSNYPGVTTSGQPWGQNTAWWETQGIAPNARTVILTNVPFAHLVYTALIVYPSLWDSLFEEAFVAALAARLALPLNKDKKLGMALRQENIAIAAQALQQARVRDGDEGFASVDHEPDFIRIRSSGGYGRWGAGGYGEGPGVLGYGSDSYDGMAQSY